MATTIAAVDGTNSIKHCLLMEITVDTVTYNVTTAWNDVVYNATTYSAVGSLLTVGTMGEDIKTNNGDLTIQLSGIGNDAIYAVLEATIKGGEVVIYRAFFDDDYTLQASNVVQRYKGIITSYGISEDVEILQGRLTSTVSITVASINSILEHRINGQRTHETDRARAYPGDTSFNRVQDLANTAFDFGKPMSAASRGWTPHKDHFHDASGNKHYADELD